MKKFTFFVLLICGISLVHDYQSEVLANNCIGFQGEDQRLCEECSGLPDGPRQACEESFLKKISPGTSDKPDGKDAEIDERCSEKRNQEVCKAINKEAIASQTFKGALCVGKSCDLTIHTVIDRVIRLMGMLAGTIAVVLYIIGGFMMITSAGEENQISQGKTIIIYTSIGLGLIFGSYMIVQFVLALVFSVK